jgi:hypothetical protein
MLHLLHKAPAPVAESAASQLSSTREGAAPVLISEQEVIFNTAAARSIAPPAAIHHHWPGTRLTAAIRHFHIGLPEPRPIYPHVFPRASYFDTARMSREMDRL